MCQRDFVHYRELPLLLIYSPASAWTFVLRRVSQLKTISMSKRFFKHDFDFYVVIHSHCFCHLGATSVKNPYVSGHTPLKSLDFVIIPVSFIVTNATGMTPSPLQPESSTIGKQVDYQNMNHRCI